ncbi:MAG: glycosyltransferase family 2 protein [Cyclobacteriaceae bacterium]|nr:glycosyltransferase family 2 protein [Cyclobacteriaceae bacterium]
MEKHQLPLVSVVILNYNQWKVTEELLLSIEKISYQNIELIIVDNASAQNPAEIVETKYPDVEFIRSEINLGYAGGNNLGIEEARGEYIFILNNDTELAQDCIERLLESFQKNKTAGIVCPKILFFDQPDTVQYAGFTDIHQITGRNRSIGYLEKDNGQFDIGGKTFFAHGAAMMIKREVIEKVGMLPELYFLYYEEMDFSMTVRRAGYDIYYEPSSVVYHKESVSVGPASPMKTYYLNRNRILFMRRNRNGFQYLMFLLYFIAVSIGKNTLVYLLKRKWSHLKMLYKGFIWHFTTKGDKVMFAQTA